MTLNATLSVGAAATLASTLDLAESTSKMSEVYKAILTNGTAAGQVDRLWSDTRTLAASANEDLDLAGALLDALGGPAVFARVKGLIIAANPANVNNIVVGNATTNGFATFFGAATHTLVLRPGSVFALLAGTADATGYAVTAGTGDLLRVTNGGAGTSVTYDVIALGTSV